jgi:biopolymer transport protein ExbB/TolQ
MIDLGDALAEIAAALRVPVLLAALAVLVWCTVEVGRFLAECRQRLRTARGLPGRSRLVATTAARIARATDTRAIEHALADFELAVQRRLDRTRILVRAGPAIGLMGTLIPLAPGLEKLGQGDVPALAADLRTAFGATVVGILVGTVAYALTLTRTRFYTQDLAALERQAGQ